MVGKHSRFADFLGRRLKEKTETCDTHSTLWYGEQTSWMLLYSEPMHGKRKKPTDIVHNLDMALILGLLLSIAKKLVLVGGTIVFRSMIRFINPNRLNRLLYLVLGCKMT